MAIFDSEAKEYDSWYDSKLGAYVDQVETDLAFSLFTPRPGMKILDIGCGTGNFSIKLAKMGCRVVGLDQSKDMLAQAKKKNPAIDFRLGDVYKLDFADQTFDGVFSMAAFEFIKEPQKAYAEMKRVLKTKGSLLIGTINRESQWGDLYQSDFFRDQTVFKHANFKAMADLKGWDPDNLTGSGECLFISPTATEEDISSEQEKRLSVSERGGFICAKWTKKG